MFAEERRELIVSTLAVHGTVAVGDLVRMLRASEVTVRRDLRALADAGRVLRYHGGARPTRAMVDEPTFLEKSVVAAQEKLAIAGVAAEILQDGEAVFLGAGTTTHALAQRLTRRHMMVATNSLLVADALADAQEVDVLLIGGLLRNGINAAIGGDAERALARLRMNTVVLSGNGLTARNGLSTPNVHVSSFDRAVAHVAERVVVLADHTKIGEDSILQTVVASRIDVVVTDVKADPAELDALRSCDVDVRVADPAHLGLGATS